MTSSNTGDLTDLYVGQQYPPELYIPLVHESTQHWCQNTMWGQLLFFLRKTSAKNAGSVLNADVPLAGDKMDLLAGNIRYQVLQQIFAPLTEGIALFSVFDSHPTSTQAIPGHLVFASMAYSGLTLEQMSHAGIENTEQAYLHFLRALRLGGPAVVQHKKELLLSPLDATKSAGLQGYLFIKSLQGMLADKHKKFWDPNVFLSFILNFFYNDIGWFSATLHPNTRPESIPDMMAAYFNRRIGQLRMLAPDLIEQFEADVTNPERVANCINMLTPDAEQQTGLALYTALYTEIIQYGEAQAQSRFFHRKYFRMVRQEAYLEITRDDRVLIYVPLTPADVTTHHEVVTINDEAYRLAMSLPNPGNYQPIKAKGSLEIYRVMQVPFNTCVVFLIDGKLLYSHFLSNWQPLDEKIFLDYFALDGPNDPDRTGIVKIALDVLLEADETLVALHTETLKNFSFGLNGLYRLTLAASCVPTELEQIKEYMKDSGFRPVLGNDDALAELLCFISLANALNMYDTAAMQDIAQQAGIVFNENALATLCQRLQEKNIYLIRYDAEYTLSTGI